MKWLHWGTLVVATAAAQGAALGQGPQTVIASPATALTAPLAPLPDDLPVPADRDRPLLLATSAPSPSQTPSSLPSAPRALPASASAQAVPSTRASVFGDARAYARSVMSEDQYTCLDMLWTRESRWDPNAYNPSSGAYGIPQFLPFTWSGIGLAKTSDPVGQVQAGVKYIGGRYGSECAALGHSNVYGWY